MVRPCNEKMLLDSEDGDRQGERWGERTQQDLKYLRLKKDLSDTNKWRKRTEG